MARRRPLLIAAGLVAGLVAALLWRDAPAAAPRARLLIDKDDAYRRDASTLAASGMKVIADYGAFVLVEAPTGQSAAGLSGRLKVRREIPEGIRLARRRVTRADTATAPAEGLHVVRLRARTPSPAAAIAGVSGAAGAAGAADISGARVLMALPDDAYLVWADPAASAALAADASVEIAAPLSALDRTSSELDAATGDTDVVLAFIDSPAGEAAAAAAGARARRILGGAPRLKGAITRALTVDRAVLDDIVAAPELLWAEPRGRFRRNDEVSSLITAGLISGIGPAAPHYRQWLDRHGFLDLSAYIVDVVDTGIDSGPAEPEHPSLSGRLVYSRDYTGEGSLEDCVGHGTHIAGIIAGDPPAGADLHDPQGYDLGLGVAPTARVGSSRIFDCTGFGEPDRSLTDIFAEAWRAGARVSNNSWGTGGGNYSLLAREFDGLVRDADGDPGDGDQPMVVLASAGNGGPNTNTIDVPAVSKNVITVGGSESYRPEGTDGCNVGPSGADDVDDVRATSSRGPTADGRLKPDVVAPASHIVSAVSRSPKYTGLGLCDNFYPLAQRLYSWTGGSSQATAHASGAAVLLMEEYRRSRGSLPSPAMVKAMMVAGARDLGTFPSPGGHRPSIHQGWGRVDVSGVVGHDDRVLVDQAKVFTAAGQEETAGPFVVADPNAPLAVVLSWTDAPGAPAGSAWVNDLDLDVTSGADVWHGNNFSAGVSIPGGGHDERNNVEMVYLRPPLPSSFTIRVVAVSLPGDGVPAHPGETDQDFALYVGNAILATQAGTVRLDAGEYRCGDQVRIVATDRGLAGTGALNVSARSGAENGPEAIALSEDPPGSGIFKGGIAIESGAPAADGRLQVTDGGSITIDYEDRDDGSGHARTATATAVARCSPPVITDVRLESVETDRAVIAWRTDRPADSMVTVPPSAVFRDATPVIEHRVPLDGLPPCTAFRYQVTSTDPAGISASFPATGTLAHSTAGQRRMALLFDDFEGFTGRWSHQGASDSWQLGAPTSGPRRAFSGTHAWGTNLSGPYAADADMALVSPPIDLRGQSGSTLTFRHTVDIPPGADASFPQDGAWVEATIDGGATWSPIAPEGGYPFLEGKGNPYLPPSSGVFAGTIGNWIETRFDLAPLEGYVIQLRFRLWRNPAAAAPPGAGWYIDDVSVTAVVPCHRATLLLDAPEYGCSSRPRLTLADSDLDRDPQRREITSVVVSSPSGSVSTLLTETTPNSGAFSGAVALSPLPSSGKLRVVAGQTIAADYNDADDGTRTSRSVRAEAAVTDCSAPSPPSGVTLAPDGAGGLRVQWTDPPESDLAEVRVNYDSDSPGPIYTGEGALEGASPIREEPGRRAASLTGLASCTTQFVSLTALDVLGNESAFSAEVTGVPRGPGPCPRSELTFLAGANAGCMQDVVVRLDDSNADADPLARGHVVVTAASSSDPSPLLITLTETGSSTGSFTGILPLTRAGAAGRLAVNEGDEVLVTYPDADAGNGLPGTAVGRLSIDDCRPPIVDGIHVAALGDGSVRIEWTTDEPASSRVEFGLDAGVERSIVSPALSLSHAVTLDGVGSCATVYYRITSTDARGNATLSDDAGLPFHAGSGREIPVLSDDLEAAAPGWTHGGVHDEWELGAPSVGPPGAWSGASVWGIDLDGAYERGADEFLVTPEIDLTGVDSATLTFQQWYDIFTSQPGAGLDDGAWVEVSRDGGATWKYVVPLGGYPDTVANNSYIPLGTGVYAGTTAGWQPAVFPLDAFTGGPIRIRFHFYQDFVDPTNALGLGWYIDDVQVRTVAACRQGRVRLDASSHDCGTRPIGVRLWDRDLDADPASIDTAVVHLSSDSDPSTLDVVLTESAPSSGAFSGAAPFGTAPAPGRLRVSEGDLVTVTYDDADDGTGSPAVATSTTRVGDCTPPVLSNVSATRLSEESAVVRWETDGPATSEASILPAGPAFQDSSLVTRHELTIQGLQACASYQLEVASADAGGNRTALPAGAVPEIAPVREVDLLSEGFETGAPGWIHGGLHDEWEFGAPLDGPASAFTGSSVAGTDLDGDYDKDPFRQRGETWLVSPWFSLADVSGAALRFHHWYSFARDTQGDGAVVEAWDGGRWVVLQPSGGYPGPLRVDRSEAPVRAYTELSGGWVDASFDLSAFEGKATRLRFRTIYDHGTPMTAPGWYLDDVRVTALVPCRRGRLELDRDAYRCAQQARLILSDADLDTDPATAQEHDVQAAIGGAVFPVPLEETGPGTGIFEGTIDLGGAGAPAAEGETLQATYADADDGDGSPRTAIAFAPIADCAAPAVTRPRLERDVDGVTMIARWRTNEPATSEVTLARAGAPPQRYRSLDLVTDHVVVFPGQPDCAAVTASIASEDAAGNRASLDAATEPRLAGETRRKKVLFRDDAEGTVPGWRSGGAFDEWEIGPPVIGPASAFSGARVWGTDLDGVYQGGTDCVLISPSIDLRGVTAARLTFWQFYDIFAEGAPNAEDDGAWVEVQVQGEPTPRILAPVGGYPDIIDRNSNPPIEQGSGVYSGFTAAWRRAVFDFTPFAGSVVQVRFRLWNDAIEGYFNQRTGAGWYLDDLEVSGSETCAAPPAIASIAPGRLIQGETGVTLQISGAGLRSPLSIDAGDGITLRDVTVVSPAGATAVADVDPAAPAIARDVTATGPDGQTAVLAAGLVIDANPSRADIDGSGAVDGRDLALLARSFGTMRGESLYSPAADLNGDGTVDGLDLALLGASFGKAIPQ